MNAYKSIPRYADGTSKLKATQSTKKKVLKRDNHKCTKCNAAAQIVHHTIPVWREPSRANEPTNLTSLCLKCHYESMGYRK